jgi:exodeoxyribonuclease VII large subunit
MRVVDTFPPETRMNAGLAGESPDPARSWQTVSQLTRAVSQALQDGFGVQRVRGEIASFTRAASGHWYFRLKDERAQVSCVMFRSRNSLVDFAPREGDEVQVLGAVGLYEARGDFQLTVEAMQRAGAGRLWEEFLRLRGRLSAEGLFDPARKRALPAVPSRVGVVTSLQAAALRDVLATLRRRAPYLGIVVYPVPVQGEEAPARIAQMLVTAGRRAEVDVLLLVRGGGSIEDLWAFNDEGVARAIAACPIPVVSGVGHESDFTIADFVADVRAPTPTAAAELVAPERANLLAQLASLARALRNGMARAHSERVQRLDHATRVLGSARGPLRALRERLGFLVTRLRSRPGEVARRSRLGLEGVVRALELADTQRILDRGFAILRGPDGAILTDAAGLAPGDEILARLARGGAKLGVLEALPPAGEGAGGATAAPGARP